MLPAFTALSQYDKSSNMSKKTKKQKILASVHREQIAVELSSGPKTSNTLKYSLNHVREVPAIKTDNQMLKSEKDINVSKDLRHTLILTVLAICAQLCVYYLLEIKHISIPRI